MWTEGLKIERVLCLEAEKFRHKELPCESRDFNNREGPLYGLMDLKIEWNHNLSENRKPLPLREHYSPYG
jgi:hypothetical protein